jgi:hypothetical protein
MRSLAVASLILALASPGPSLAALAEPRAVRIPEIGTLHVALPQGWMDAVARGEEGAAPIVTFSATKDEPFNLELTVIPVDPDRRGEALGADALRATVQRMADDVRGQAVERPLVLAAMGGGKTGYYFGATDRDPAPGEFTYLIQGALALDGGALCIFTLLTNGGGSPAVPRALEVLRQARFEPAPPARKIASLERRGSTYRIALPQQRGTITFPAGGFAVELQDDARPYYFLTDPATGLGVSFNFEPARDCTTSESCRDLLGASLRKSYPGRRDWKDGRVGDVFLTENTDPGTESVRLDQHHVNAHLVVHGVWIDVHLSKVSYREADRALFLDFIRSLEAKAAP